MAELLFMQDQSGLVSFVIFIMLCCCLLWLRPFLSGWRKLAKKYQSSQQPYGKAFHWQSGYIGLMAYNREINIRLTREGMFVSVVFLHSLGHPTLFIPWTEIHIGREEWYFWRYTVTIEIGHPPIVTMKLPKKIFDQREVTIKKADS